MGESHLRSYGFPKEIFRLEESAMISTPKMFCISKGNAWKAKDFISKGNAWKAKDFIPKDKIHLRSYRSLKENKSLVINSDNVGIDVYNLFVIS